MDFEFSDKSKDLQQRLQAFIDEHVHAAEPVYDQQLEESGRKGFQPPVMEELKVEARRRGLWNLFLPDEKHGPGLSNLDYAPLAEIMGRTRLASEATNCAAPDTGNMEILAMFATTEQRQQWLDPLLEGEIRSCFGMTEPQVASSDARNIETSIRRDGDEYVINGRKWWSSNIFHERCEMIILMGKTDPDADSYRQQSMIIVPRDTPGVEIERDLSVFGYHSNGGHGVVSYNDVRVPASNLLGEEGSGFAIAQARLGPGRIHHCMRSLGVAERALELMCDRAEDREPFGRPLIEQGVIREWIAEARIEIEQARLLVLKTAWLMDTVGNKGARTEIAAIKVSVPNVALKIIDRAIQVHGGGGVSQDFPLAAMYANMRTLKLADGPDEVHKRTLAREEIHRQRERREAAS